MAGRTPPILAALLALSVVLAGCGGKNGTATGSTGGGSQPQATVAAPAQPQTSAGAAAGATGGAAAAGTQCPASNAKSFAKTRFVLHTAEGFGAFHRYLYGPYRAGVFTKPGGRIKAFVKAGAAALFIKRQVRLASEDVRANPTLCKLIAAPLAKVGDEISGAVTKLKGGDPSGIKDANTSIASIESAAASQGAAVKEDINPNLTSTG